MKNNDINIRDILYDICEDEAVYDDDTELIDSGILDSFAMIELFYKLEDHGIAIQTTRIDRSRLKTVKGIEELINEYSD